MIYIMSDLHGDFQNFYKMLIKINFSHSDIMYILGDILDKNSENMRLYEFIREQSNIFLIKGNHEYSCERYLEGKISAQTWEIYGGYYTIQEVEKLEPESRKRLCEYLKGLPFYTSLKVNGTEYFLTHSGIRAGCCVEKEDGVIDIQASVDMAVKESQESYLISDDINYMSDSLRFDKKVIVGHYPTLLLPDCYGSAKIYYGKNYINIDTGNDRREEGGRMACLRLDDGKEYYI